MKRKQIAVVGRKKAIMAIEQAMVIGDALNANPTVFPNPIPSGDALKDAATNANVSFNEAQGGSRIQRNRFKTDMAILIGMLRAICNYVNFVADGDTNKILLSGFTLSKLPERHSSPEPVKKIEATYVPRPGQAKVNWGGSQFHRYYALQTTTDPTDATSWKDVATLTARQMLVNNLASGKLHYFRVVAVGSRGVSAPSDIASVMVA